MLFRKNTVDSYPLAIMIFISTIAWLLTSPKFFVAPALWVAVISTQRLLRDVNWKGYLLIWIMLGTTAIIGQWDVIPLPWRIMVPMLLLIQLPVMLPYWIDRISQRYLPKTLSVFVFPACYTLLHYYLDQGPQGTWGNPVYTQYHFTPFIQLSSLGGIYLLNFLIAWFSSVGNTLWENKMKLSISTSIWLPLVLVLGVGLVYGMHRLRQHEVGINQQVASIVLKAEEVMETMYTCSFQKTLHLPDDVSMSSPVLVEMQRGLQAFLENPGHRQYQPVFDTINDLLQEYLDHTLIAAEQGARIISWPEAAIMTVRDSAAALIDQARLIADTQDLFLFLPIAIVYPDKVNSGGPFMANQIQVIDPEGEVVNTYYKNIPIAGVEPSFSGDGNLPIIDSPFGALTPAICYDADFPILMRQAGIKGSDLLVVPTGDWQAISPYHTYMAAFRCIENGIPMLKPSKGGLSAFIDNKGRILDRANYFEEKNGSILIGEIPIGRQQTIFTRYENWFASLLHLIFTLLIFISILKSISSWFVCLRFKSKVQNE